MLNSEVLENWDFDKTWTSWEIIDANTNTWNIFDTDAMIDGSTDKAILSHEWINEIENINTLSEKDKKIEAEATAAIIWYVLAMLVPVAWDIESLPADIQDILWSQDGLIQVLKQTWQLPENYNRVNHLSDKLLGVVWVIASITVIIWVWIGINKILKSWKLAKYTNRLKKLWVKNPEKMIEKAFNKSILKKEIKQKNIDQTKINSELKNSKPWDIIEINTWNSIYVFKKINSKTYESVWWSNENLIWNIINKQENLIITNNWKIKFWWIETSVIKSINKLENPNKINDISSAKSIEELLKIIESKWKIWNYKSDYLIDLIYKYINWVNNVKLENITRTDWLRNIVALLKNNDLIKKSSLRQLWPNWLDSTTKQWQIWNCYFVAWLNTLKNHPNWWNILKKMIKIKWHWVYEVNFKWYNKPIIITKNDLNEMWKAKIETNNIWDLIIERAHAKIINKQRWWKSGETFINNLNDFNHAWGHSDEVLDLLLWNEVTSFRVKNKFNKYINKWFEKYDFMWLYSKLEKTDKNFYNIKDYNWKNIKIYYSHAYSIKNINKQNWSIDIINPHDSSVTLKFKIKELENNFSTFFWGEYKKS